MLMGELALQKVAEAVADFEICNKAWKLEAFPGIGDHVQRPFVPVVLVARQPAYLVSIGARNRPTAELLADPDIRGWTEIASKNVDVKHRQVAAVHWAQRAGRDQNTSPTIAIFWNALDLLSQVVEGRWLAERQKLLPFSLSVNILHRHETSGNLPARQELFAFKRPRTFSVIVTPIRLFNVQTQTF
jgi:hypothetical protein